ncbi:sensor histidine kinase [Urechidicola vernalis]|uniref:histidine kinase n=1 Tax=Urechidicola vernalis TaxID=3075600 RepID=A0ABU2YAA0_9FLAO|nr:ATP-binding protein [Urechidicola sp. P050]MDT0554170.1 ATP-binding protein [Urechidicola sp. P050]
MKSKKTYAFAFWCASLISLFLIGILFVIHFLLNRPVEPIIAGVTILGVFIFSFVIIQIRVELFIYSRIKKIYDEVSLLDQSDLMKTSITTDMENLSEEVRKFAEQKQIEITSLTEQESYRREFLGNVAHELKTPLFTVQGYLLTLLDGAMDDSEISEKYLNRATKGVERLVAIVQDLDLISKLESNEMTLEIEPFNIVELIEGIIELLEIRSKPRGITIVFDKNYDVPVLVYGDKKRMEQVLTNLIVNSLKYGKLNGTTTLSIEPNGHKKVLVKVTDNGEGIQKEHLSRLFERFYRVDQSRSREQGGSGLGLAIVKHIIEAHDETILVKSEFGKGSEFSFTMKKVK